MCAEDWKVCSCVHGPLQLSAQGGSDVLLKIDNKDKFLLNSVLIAILLFYDK